MPNTTNGVRGGPSKRSDQKRNLESKSLDGQDPSRGDIEKFQNSVDMLAHSSGAIMRLAKTAAYFQSQHTDDMQIIEDDYGTEIAQEDTIRKLKEMVDFLKHSRSEEMDNLRQENTRLMAGQEKCQQEIQKALDIQKKVEDQHALAEASRKKESEQKLQEEKNKVNKALRTKKAEMEEEYKKKGRELDEKMSKLLAANVELKQRCKEGEEKLETKKIRHARMEKSLEDENKRLTEELKQLQAQFPVEEQVVDY